MREIKGDLFKIESIGILNRETGLNAYDFPFREYFDCRSITAETDAPILLHIGAIRDYASVEKTLRSLGMSLLVSECDHLRCSQIENWYPLLKEKTPHTRVYDTLPSLADLGKEFSFPVFVKGSRQTNRHEKAKSIIESPEQYEKLRSVWKQDPILFWQKAAVREYVPLQVVDDQSYPDRLPVCYEFRFFYFRGECLAYGPYWTIGKPYSFPEEETLVVRSITDWAARQLNVPFLAIDIGRTKNGDWVIIEVNDAQESSFAGINPIVLWNRTLQTMQGQLQVI